MDSNTKQKTAVCPEEMLKRSFPYDSRILCSETIAFFALTLEEAHRLGLDDVMSDRTFN